MTKDRLILFFIGVGLGIVTLLVYQFVVVPAQQPDPPPGKLPAPPRKQLTFEVMSDAYLLDRPFMSMHGPHSWTPEFALGEGVNDDLLWLRGITTQIVDARTLTPVSDEYMCHANLMLNESFGAPNHNAAFRNTTHQPRRLFTQVPGRLNLRFPDGFGIPVRNGEEMRYLSMAINLNHDGQSRRVRFHTQIDYLPQSKAETKMKPLFLRALYVMQPIDVEMTREFEKRFNFNFKVCESCAPDRPVAASKGSVRDDAGRPVTVHWFVHPGKHVFRQRVTRQLDLPFDTTAHYMTAHLHPKAKWIKLRDLTADEDVFISHSKDWSDRDGVEHMDELRVPDDSKKLFKDHDYELICEYENDTKWPVDAMGIMYLYLHDKEADLTLDRASRDEKASPAD